MANKKKKSVPAHRPASKQRPENTRAAAAGPGGFSPVFWTGAALALFAFLLYANTLGHGYVLDDPLAIGKNELVKKGIGGIGELFGHHYRAGTEGAGASALLYRPLSLVTFAIEWSLSPNSPGLGHFMNALWYALTAAVGFAALRLLFQGYHWLWAAGAMLLFAAHPLHTEVVANIKSRDEILNLFFAMAALYAWARWLEQPAGKWLGLALGAYFLALLSKESAVTFLPVFPLASWFFFRKTARQSAGHALLFAVPAVLFLVLRAAVLSHTTDNFVVSEMDNPIVTAQGFGERSATSFMVLWKYFQLLLFPQPLISDYSFRHLTVVNWSNWQALAGLAVYAGLLVYSIRGLQRREALAFCTAAFLCGVALYSQLPLVIGTLLGERLMYAPSLWFCAAAAFLIWKISRFDLREAAAQTGFPEMKKWSAGAGILLVLALAMAALTLRRNPDWASNLALFSADVAKAPQSVRLHNGMGSELYALVGREGISETERNELLERMRQHSQAGADIRPNPVSYLNLGNVAISKNQFAEAIANYQKALDQAPNYGLARINIGRSYQAWGR
ncbi:MAG: DUF1736 domain-containing protein, partial [Saprospiraceae bacterium]|nr:DUF1736 domain-containing protein [Saprospiraceae bacterium]